MARPNPIRSIMTAELPPAWIQRRLPFRPNDEFAKYTYGIINKYVFDGVLTRPDIKLGTIRKAWGLCSGGAELQPTGSFCTLRLMDKWYAPSWFVNTLAHEMAHQWQFDIDGIAREADGRRAIMSHGPSFFIWRDRFEYYGLHLKTYHNAIKWFEHQDFHYC